MEAEIVLTGIFILVLVIVATAKSALDELSDVSLRLLASETEAAPQGQFLRSISKHHRRFSFTLTFGIHVSIASIAILLTSLAFRIDSTRFLWIAFGGMIVTVILFRQIIPLLLTQNDPARTLVLLRYPLRIVYPPLSLIAQPIYRYLRRLQRDEEPESEHAGEQTDDVVELKALIDVGEEEGILEESEGAMIQSIIRFSDRKVGEVMTPRPNIVAIEAGASLEAVRDLMIESKYSRLPVYREQLDHIEGIIYVRDLLACWAQGTASRTAVKLARATYFVPETKPIDELLREMQKAKVQMAIVIDEYGGLAGLVTLEDLIEEIVGEIEDEDEPDPQAAEADIVVEEDGSYVVRGNVEVGKIERLFGIELAADDFTTVAGLVINQLGQMPAVGETLSFRDLLFEVLGVDERRVSRVRIRATKTVSNGSDTNGKEIAGSVEIGKN
ncbi:MAG: hemolysin family protein [Acidobacteriota bacterium]